MGSKSSSAPAPDPRLIGAQIKSMGIQDSAIQQILAQSNAMLPLQQQQMQFGIDTAHTAWDQSQQDRQWALGKRSQLDQAQKPILEQAANFNEGARADEIRGQANSDIEQASQASGEAQQRELARRGVNPSSGAALALANQNAMGTALAKAQAGTTARDMARTQGIQLRSNAANMLSGFPSMASGLSGSGAGFGASGINIANSGLAGMSSGFGSAAQIAGSMGTNATGMWGAQANYKLGSDAQAAANNPFASILGAGATLGAAYLGRPSDRRLKHNIELVGKDDRTGLNLYEFNYLDDPEKRRFVGVMSDEVRKVMPEAVTVDSHGYDLVLYDKLGLEMTEVGYAE